MWPYLEKILCRQIKMRSLAWVPTQCDWYSSCNKRKFGQIHSEGRLKGRQGGREGSQLSGPTKRRSCLKQIWSVKTANFHVMRQVKDGSLPLYISAQSDQTKKPDAFDAAHLPLLPLLPLAAPPDLHLESSSFWWRRSPEEVVTLSSLLPDPSAHHTGHLSHFLSLSSERHWGLNL